MAPENAQKRQRQVPDSALILVIRAKTVNVNVPKGYAAAPKRVVVGITSIDRYEPLCPCKTVKVRRKGVEYGSLFDLESSV